MAQGSSLSLKLWPLVCESTGLEYEHNRLLNLLEYVSNQLTWLVAQYLT